MRRRPELSDRAHLPPRRFGATEEAEGYQQVTQVQMIQACGDGARYLKPYQLVGVNFLNLLYRQKIGGGEELAGHPTSRGHFLRRRLHGPSHF